MWNTYVSSGGISFKTFETYDKALKRFAETKPIRGRAVECRPLGNNRGYTQCEIRHDALTDEVYGVLYDSKVFSIDSEGIIKLFATEYVTPSTTMFIDACLPPKWGSVRLHRRKIIYTTKVTAEQRANNIFEKEYVIPKDGLILKANQDWSSVEVLDTQPSVTNKQYEYKADRKVLNRIRKQYAPFLSMVDVYSAMSTTYSVAEICEYFPNVVSKYVDLRNEHEKEQREKFEQAKMKNEPYHHWSFNKKWTMRDVIMHEVGYPSFGSVIEWANHYKLVLDGQGEKTWYSHHKDSTNKVFTHFMEALREGLSDDVQTLRKLMIKIVANPNNYAIADDTGQWGDTNEVVTVPSLFGDIEVPNLYYSVSGNGIENYFINIIKYVYADLIFKKVEVPSGTIPSQTNVKYMVINEYLKSKTDILSTREVVLE